MITVIAEIILTAAPCMQHSVLVATLSTLQRRVHKIIRDEEETCYCYLSSEHPGRFLFNISYYHQKWKKDHDKPRQYIKKQRHCFANKGPSSQNYSFSSSHVWMWELDYKESRVPRNRCFWTVVGEDCWESLGLQGDQTSE